jgi:tape measure domain-containing protein
MPNEQKISEIVDPSVFKQFDDLIKKVGEASAAMAKAIVTVAEYHKELTNAKGIAELQSVSSKAVLEHEKVRKATAQATLAEEKLAQTRAKGVADAEKNAQREIAAQNKRIEADDRRSRSAAKSAKDIETAREKERLAELRLDADRKKAFDRYEAELKRKAAAESREAAQLARKNAIIEESSRAYRKLASDLEAARRKAQDIGVTFGVTSNEFRAASREANELNARIMAIDRSMGINQTSSRGFTGALGSITSALSGMAAGFLSAAALISNAFTTALKTDAIKTSLEFTFNSVDVAKQKMEDLRKTADRLGLEYTSLADAYRSFAGAAVASNFPMKETDKIFNAVANAGAKLKLTSDQVTGALTALQQMISKGTVQSEELRGQLGERLPGAFAIAARAMGVTQIELGKLLKDGKVMASDLLPKLADELDKTFSNDKNENVKSLQGSVNALKNSFSEIVETKGALSAFFQLVVDQAAGATRYIAKLSEALGIFYDLATDPKKLIGDSAKASRNQTFGAIADSARTKAAKTAESAGSKPALFDRINTEVMLLKVLTSSYTDLEKTYNKTKQGDRTLTDTQKLQESNKAVKAQLYFVRALRSEYQTLYGSNGTIKETADADLTSVKAIQARINELKKLEGSAIIGNAIYERIQKLQERLKKPGKATPDTSAKDSLALERVGIVGEQSAAKRVADDETIGYETRFKAAEQYAKKSKDLIENEKRTALLAEGLNKTKILTINKEASNKLIELGEETAKIQDKIVKDNLNKEEKERVAAAQIRENAILTEEADKINILSESYKNGNITYKEFNEERLRIQKEYARKLLDAELSDVQTLLKNSKLSADKRIEYERQLTAIKSKLANMTADEQEELAQRVAKTEKELLKQQEKLQEDLRDKKKQLQQEIKDLTISVIDGIFENQKEKVQDEIDLNDKKKEIDIENVNNSVDTEEEKANKIAIIEARAAAQREQLEIKQRQIEEQRKRWKKLAAIAEIGITTAKDVFALTSQAALIKAQAALLASNPLTLAYAPIALTNAALTLAQIPYVIGIGAAQIGALMAFEKGGTVPKDMPIITGEKGTELRINPDGTKEFTAPFANITNAKAGTKIIPNHELVKMMTMPNAAVPGTIQTIDIAALLTSQDKSTTRIEKALSKIQVKSDAASKTGWYNVHNGMFKLSNYKKDSL